MTRFILKEKPRRDILVPRLAEFETAHEVAIFMWGKDSRDWTIYIERHVLAHDITALEQELKEAHKRWNP